MNLVSEFVPSGPDLGDYEFASEAEAPRQRTVLLVDDDESAAVTLVSLLRLKGFDADCVFTGIAALARAMTVVPDAVILDLHMAAGDLPGLLVLKSLRSRYPELVIIAITGWYLRDSHEEEARALGVSDYLLKPVDDESLTASLRTAFGRRRKAPDPREVTSPAGQRSLSRARPLTSSARWSGEGAGPELAASEANSSGAGCRGWCG
jgi:DNA-binding response OmpR family regulator